MRYDERCVAAVNLAGGGVDRCQREAYNSDPMYLTLIPICSWHAVKARNQFAGPLEEEVASLKKSAAGHECDGQRAVSEYITKEADWHLERTAEWRKSSSTYFIRCGDYIKIGAGASPAARLNAIRHTGGVLHPKGLDLSGAELIAAEPGGFDRERELHVKFSHLRHTGEWFTEAKELTDYIKGLAA